MLRNWARNVRFSTDQLHRPTSLDEVSELVANSRRVKCLGTAHSFSDVADTDGVLLTVADLPPRIEVDAAAGTATLSGALRWGDVGPVLHEAGVAVHNLGSLPHISIAGTCATGTHGSGNRLGCLSTAVRGLELVTPSGEVVTVTRDDPDFAGHVVSLGALGVVTALTLDVQPTYDVRQAVFERLPRAAVAEHLDEIMGAADSVSLMMSWREDVVEQVWTKQRVDAPSPVDLTWTGAERVARPWDPATTNMTDQSGAPGPWYAMLPHFRLEATPSAGDELQTEYLVAREDGVPAMAAVQELRDVIAPALLITEIRSVAADDLWLSPAQGRDSLAIHFTWRPEPDKVLPALPRIEEALRPFAARPHWGKVFSTGAEELARIYPALPRFRDLVARRDPEGRFRNPFLERTVLDPALAR